MSLAIRYATDGDAAAILDIYAPYVRDTPVSFEETVPSLEAFTQRIAHISAAYPYLACTEHGALAAYAYASPHMTRAAYRFDVQTSVYAAPEHHGRGMGKALYRCLFALLAKLGYYNAFAITTLPNEKSLALHQAMGFVPAGVHHKSGYKLGQWHDVAWLEKTLADHAVPPDRPKTPGELDAAWCADVFAANAAAIRPAKE